MSYNFKSIEKKWQKKWGTSKAFVAKKSGKKFYVLEMYPYPSGEGLHMGHAFNYVISDVLARMRRMQGFNVMYPIGYDSLGLPAENAAIKKGIHPKKYTEKAIANFLKQQRELGLSYDWSRLLATHDSDYYKWDQWIFLKMFEKGLVYKKKSIVNWCDKCKTVLANEQVHDGKCWRHEDTEVIEKDLEQWFFKITDYADELYEDIEKLKGWPERIKTMQKNWIGKSHGTEILFDINGKKWPIFTTRPDTIYGVTFMVISSQHSKLMNLVTSKQKNEVEKFVKKAKLAKDDELDKEGVFTGSYAINPVNNEKVPIWVGNFVLADYGSGMVMAVPGHDQRDFDFAKRYNLSIKEVIEGGDINKEAYEGEGVLVNSEKFNGVKSEKAREEITKFLSKKKLGEEVVQFRLRDWLISRQRYWGTPIPVVYCDKCGVVLVPEKQLPVKLPEKVKFGKGNPLESAKTWINTKCPKCKGKAKRETDTMDTFVNSSWYFLRYCDPKNKKAIFDKKKVDYWMPIDQYIGGAEHACMHLIYFRFYTKFLRDLGLLNFDEPALNLFNQGMLHGNDGYVMSKSRGNVVLPEQISKKYGIDTARLFLMSIATPDKDIAWSDKGIQGAFRFIKRVMDYFSRIKVGKAKPDTRIESKLNKTIENFTKYIEDFKYNLAIIELRALFDSFPENVGRDILEKFLKMLSVFCPHISEELWKKIKGKGLVSLSSWPKVDKKKINVKFEKEEEAVESLISDITQIKGLVKAEVSKAFVYVIPNEKEFYFNSLDLISKRANLDVKVFAVNDKTKYDPENKSKKARPGKPGIYLE